MLSSYEYTERKRETLSTDVTLQLLHSLYIPRVIPHDFKPDLLYVIWEGPSLIQILGQSELVSNITCDSGCCPGVCAGQSFYVN